MQCGEIFSIDMLAFCFQLNQDTDLNLRVQVNTLNSCLLKPIIGLNDFKIASEGCNLIHNFQVYFGHRKVTNVRLNFLLPAALKVLHILREIKRNIFKK